jgi:hypothetical protein
MEVLHDLSNGRPMLQGRPRGCPPLIKCGEGPKVGKLHLSPVIEQLTPGQAVTAQTLAKVSVGKQSDEGVTHEGEARDPMLVLGFKFPFGRLQDGS